MDFLAIGLIVAAAVLFLIIGIDIQRNGRLAHAPLSEIRPRRLKDMVYIFSPAVKSVFTEDVRLNTEKKLVWAGIEDIDADYFLSVRLAISAGAAITTLLLSALTGLDLFWTMGAAIAGYIVPDMWLDSKAKQRQSDIRKAMPDFGMFFSTALEAGGGDIYGALELSASRFGGALGKEVTRTAQDINTGRRRADALEELSLRCGVEEMTMLVDTIVQADRHGTPLGEAVKKYSAYVREIRTKEAEKRAGEIVVKMVFPMLVFIIVPLLVMLMYPQMKMLGEILGG